MLPTQWKPAALKWWVLFDPVQFRTIRRVQEIPLLIGECPGEGLGKSCRSWQSTWQSLPGEQRSKQLRAVPCFPPLPAHPWSHQAPSPTLLPPAQSRRFPGAHGRWWHLVVARFPYHWAPESTVWPPSPGRAGRHSLSFSAAPAPDQTPPVWAQTKYPHSVQLLPTASDAPATDFNSLLSLLFPTRTCCWQSFKSASNLLYYKYS